MIITTFEEALIASKYYYQPETGCYWKEDSHYNVHTYVEQENNTWSYERYNQYDKLVTSKVFTLD